MAIQVQVIVETDEEGRLVGGQVRRLHLDGDGRLYGMVSLTTWGDWIPRSEAESNPEAVTFKLAQGTKQAGLFIIEQKGEKG